MPAPCLIYESSPYGFGSNILGLLLTMTANNRSSRLYYDESTWIYKCNGSPSWSKFFSGPVPLQILEGVRPPDTCARVTYEGCDKSGHDVLKNVDSQKVFNRMRQSVQSLWQLSGQMQRKADAQTAYIQSLQKPVIGIVIRAGDKAFEDQIWGERPANWYKEKLWVQNLKILLQDNGYKSEGTCLLFSDDLTALYEATKTLKSEMSCLTIQIGGWEGGFHRDAWLTKMLSHGKSSGSKPESIADESCIATSDLVLQLEALSKADIFTGSYNSNLVRIVHLLRFHVFGKAKQTAQDVLKSIEWHHDYRFKPSS
jgi:hypothetical protein